MTAGAGVELCFDGVGGETMMQSLRCLGRGGRHLVVGFASGIEAEEIPMVSGRALCFGNFDIVGVILAYVDAAVVPRMTDHVQSRCPASTLPTTQVGGEVQAHLLELLTAGAIRPMIGRTVPFEGLAQALDDMESRDDGTHRRHAMTSIDCCVA